MEMQTLDDGQGQIDSYAPLHNGTDRLFVAYSRFGVSAVRLAQDEAAFETWFRAQLGRPLRRCATLPAELIEAIRDQVQGSDCPVPLDLRASTDFERAVLLKTRDIPRGEVRTYGWIARQIGEPGAAQDVGVALSLNPILYLIPCHRVVRSDGSLGGYAGGGVSAKRKLLLSEGYQPTRGKDSTWIRWMR
jgi:methylated-DNA-[protein]-cysteine S-methyltransferase